jgi:hypothetical protein
VFVTSTTMGTRASKPRAHRTAMETGSASRRVNSPTTQDVCTQLHGTRRNMWGACAMWAIEDTTAHRLSVPRRPTRWADMEMKLGATVRAEDCVTILMGCVHASLDILGRLASIRYERVSVWFNGTGFLSTIFHYRQRCDSAWAVLKVTKMCSCVSVYKTFSALSSLYKL